MAANRANIELVALPKDTESPSCPHGPTLLFERIDKVNKRPRQFYACSAFRDRKACSFFLWADQNVEKSKLLTRSSTEESYCHRMSRKRYFQFKKLPRKLRHVCCTCGLLLLEEESSFHESKGHSLRHSVGLKDLKHSSSLFRPLDDNKTFAQYLFSKTAVDFLIDSVIRLGYTHILCVGTPRIHEEVQFRRKSGINVTSLLLDLDERYAQVYPPPCFIKYNMFNHHFFEKTGNSHLAQFFSDGNEHVVLITDPPFGGMVEALVATFTKISQMWSTSCTIQSPGAEQDVKDESVMTPHPSLSEPGHQQISSVPYILSHHLMLHYRYCPRKLIPLVWFFPYFMENRIVSQLPEMSMLDYKVDYENHVLFNGLHKKKGSPVRIFTNIAQSLFSLPLDEGYWFCQPCQRFSSKENWHCKDCRTCTSKDGTRYVHCDMCMRCVKPSRVHCFTCQMCQLKDHVCGKFNSSGCHICGELDHKRRECPQRRQEKIDTPSLDKRGQKRTTDNSRGKQNKRSRRK